MDRRLEACRAPLADAIAAAVAALGVALLCAAVLDDAAYGRFLVSLIAR